MDAMKQAFFLLPDTVIITDAYWYIVDFNHAGPFEGLRRGSRLTRHMPGCCEEFDDEYQHRGRIYQRKVTRISKGSSLLGYTIYLSDITEERLLVEQRRRKNAELEELTKRQAAANAELEQYAQQARDLSTHAEQLRIARHIHDNAGHAITALHAISRMCLRVGQIDPARYRTLLEEGIDICRNAARSRPTRACSSVRELLETFRDENPSVPVEVLVTGDDPPFAPMLYETIHRVCAESYHNTLSHSLAEKMRIEAYMEPGRLTLRLVDDGAFRGPFEKGFGLTALEEGVRSSGGSVRFCAAEGKGFETIVEWGAGHE